MCVSAEREALQAELEDSKARAQSVQLDLVEQLAQAVTDITLLHHTLRQLTNDVHTALTTKVITHTLLHHTLHTPCTSP